MQDTTYKIDDLARAAGISARTVRYYVQRGLIPAPAFRGKDSAYGHEHLVRLKAIRKMQDAFFPLDAIAIELEQRSLEAIEKIADGNELPGATAVVQTIVTAPMPTFSPMIPTGTRTRTERSFRRVEIAPGVELTIADDAPLESRRLAEKILRELSDGD